MKITKSKLQEIVLEELSNLFVNKTEIAEDSDDNSLSSDLVNIGADANTKLQDVIDKLEDLDISLDYIAGALTGVDPSEISRLQRGHGRAASASPIPAPVAPTKKDEI